MKVVSEVLEMLRRLSYTESRFPLPLQHSQSSNNAVSFFTEPHYSVTIHRTLYHTVGWNSHHSIRLPQLSLVLQWFTDHVWPRHSKPKSSLLIPAASGLRRSAMNLPLLCNFPFMHFQDRSTLFQWIDNRYFSPPSLI